MKRIIRINIYMLLSACMLLVFMLPAFAKGGHGADSAQYRKNVRYVLQEHKKLQKHLVKICKKDYPDSLIAEKYLAISSQYNNRVKHYCYLGTKKTKEPLSKQFIESEAHKGIIERTYKQLNEASNTFAASLLAKGYAKEAANLQKQAFYSSGKYQYFKKFHASSFLDAIHSDKVAALKQSQQFTMPVVNTAKQAGSLNQLKAGSMPKIALPANLQTNNLVNNVFAFDKPAEGPSKKQKFQDALSGKQFDLPLDSTIKDTMLFRPNPYRLMPWQDRLKLGGNFEGGQLLTGDKKFSYTINLTWLLTPNIKPVIGAGYQHSFALSRGNVKAESVGLSMKAGAELRVYKALSLFGNFEHSSYTPGFASEGNARKNDFVIGLTNDTGKKRLLKIWIGIKLGELAARNANPFVFRVGL